MLGAAEPASLLEGDSPPLRLAPLFREGVFTRNRKLPRFTQVKRELITKAQSTESRDRQYDLTARDRPLETKVCLSVSPSVPLPETTRPSHLLILVRLLPVPLSPKLARPVYLSCLDLTWALANSGPQRLAS